jgi:hypothetical protein
VTWQKWEPNSTEPALDRDVAPLGLAGSHGWVNLVGVSVPGHTWVVVVVGRMWDHWDGRREKERGGKDVGKGYALTKQTYARQSPTTQGPMAGVFEKPIPVETRTHGRGYGFYK